MNQLAGLGLVVVLAACGRKAEPDLTPPQVVHDAQVDALDPVAVKPLRIDKHGTETTIIRDEHGPDLDAIAAAYDRAPEEPSAVDGEKVARLGLHRDPALTYYIAGGDVWGYPSGLPPLKVAATGIKQNIKFSYYLDGAGDVARRRK